MNGVQTRLKCKPNVKRCKRFVFAAHSPLLHPNTLKTKAIIHFQTDHILTRFVFPPLGVVDASTGTVSVRAAFPNKNGLLHSGSSGNVVVPSVYKDGIIIPRAATYEVQDKVFVYKVVDGKTHSTQVSVERVDGGQDYIVTTGLAIGDEIVTEGVGLLQDGMPITKKKQLTQN